MTRNRKYTNFLIIFFVLIFLYLWDGFLTGNEAQTLADVYRFAHPQWLKNDWFLSLPTAYRIPFNIVLYPLAKILSLSVLAFTSRILLITLMSISLTYFFGAVKLSPGSIALFTLVAFRMKGMLAGEDMLWHVEAKILSYILVIAGITSLLKSKHKRMWLFLGGAATFHPLVGGYSVIALLFSLVFYKKRENFSILRTSPFFALTGLPGVGIVLYNLVSSRKASGGVADLIYVARHHHHMVPTDFIRHVHKGFPVWLDYTILIGNLVFCAVVLIIAFIKLEKYSKEKKLLYYTIGSGAIFASGLVLYFTGQYHLLKYYPFRFPDVIIPFTSYALFLYGADRFLFNKKPLTGPVVVSLIIAVTGALFALETKSIINEKVPIALHMESTENQNLYKWIRAHTPKESVFIINPFIDNFNITAERAQFVSFKNIPQNEKDVRGWYGRLVLLNKGKEFYDGKISFNLQYFNKNYLLLTDRELKTMSTKYKLDYYVGPVKRVGDFPEVYRNAKWGVYRLR